MAVKTNGSRAPVRSEPAKQRPVYEARFGRLRASVWRQESDKGPWYNVVLSRTYKDADGKYQTANSFSAWDLLEVARPCEIAHDWIHREMARNRNQNGLDTDSEPGQNDEIPY